MNCYLYYLLQSQPGPCFDIIQPWRSRSSSFLSWSCSFCAVLLQCPDMRLFPCNASKVTAHWLLACSWSWPHSLPPLRSLSFCLCVFFCLSVSRITKSRWRTAVKFFARMRCVTNNSWLDSVLSRITMHEFVKLLLPLCEIGCTVRILRDLGWGFQSPTCFSWFFFQSMKPSKIAPVLSLQKR